MRRSGLAACAVPVLLALANLACAEQVGRTTFELPAGGWQRLASHEHALVFDQGQTTLPLFSAAYVLPGSGTEVRALLVVTSSDAGLPGRVRWVSEPCAPARPRYFTDDYGTNTQPQRRDCLVVNSAFAPSLYFAKDDWLLTALRERQWSLPKGGISLRSVVGTTNGGLLRVNLVTRKGFAGQPPGPMPGRDLHDVAPELVAWGMSLHDAVHEGALSARGTLTLPAMSFAAE